MRTKSYQIHKVIRFDNRKVNNINEQTQRHMKNQTDNSKLLNIALKKKKKFGDWLDMVFV